MEDELSEPEKKDLRIKYAQLIRENGGFIDMIEELRKPNTDYIMIQKPKVIDHNKKGSVEDKKEDKKEDKVKKYTYDEQVKILVGFYEVVDPNKTIEDITRLINNRRPKGKDIGTQIPSVPWLTLCDKLSDKYDNHPLKLS